MDEVDIGLALQISRSEWWWGKWEDTMWWDCSCPFTHSLTGLGSTRCYHSGKFWSTDEDEYNWHPRALAACRWTLSNSSCSLSCQALLKKNIITITFLSCCICNHFCNDILPVYSYHCPCPACTGWQNQRSRCSFGRPQASLPPTEILILLAPQGGALRIGTYRDSHPSYHPLIAFEH